MEVLLVPEARDELASVSRRERDALDHAIEKVRTLDTLPGHPHTSRVLGSDRVWEMRPRAGRSRHRAFYRVIRGTVVIGSIGPEALVDPRGFRRAVNLAEERLAQVEERS